MSCLCLTDRPRPAPSQSNPTHPDPTPTPSPPKTKQEELGEDANGQDVMVELGARWKALDDEEKAPYEKVGGCDYVGVVGCLVWWGVYAYMGYVT